MTWKEFKARVEAQGVKDNDEIWYIDWQDFDVEAVKDEVGWRIF